MAVIRRNAQFWAIAETCPRKGSPGGCIKPRPPQVLLALNGHGPQSNLSGDSEGLDDEA